MKQTSLEWLEKNIRLDMSPFELTQLFDQAKAMHKEEIVKAWKSGVDYRDYNGHGSTYLEIELGEQPNKYYNETFNTKEK